MSNIFKIKVPVMLLRMMTSVLVVLATFQVGAQSVFSEIDADTKPQPSVQEKRIEIKNTKPNIRYRSAKTEAQSVDTEDASAASITDAADEKKKRFFQTLDFDKPLYLGLGLSRTEVSLLRGTRTDEDTTIRFNGDDNAVSYWLFLGMTYNQYVDIELRYHDYGGFEQSVEVADASEQIQVLDDVALDYQSLGIMLRPKLALGSLFQLHAEVGLAIIRVERSLSVTVEGGQNPDDLEAFQQILTSKLKTTDDNALSLTYGVGAEYKGRGNYAWRYDLYRSEIDDDELSSHVLSVIRRF